MVWLATPVEGIRPRVCPGGKASGPPHRIPGWGLSASDSNEDRVVYRPPTAKEVSSPSRSPLPFFLLPQMPLLMRSPYHIGCKNTTSPPFSSSTPVYTSADFGVSWTQQTGHNFSNVQGLASSSTGQYLAAADRGVGILVSLDYGRRWVSNNLTKAWDNVAMSHNGSFLVAAVYHGRIWTSKDAGSSWVQQTNTSSQQYMALACSSTGKYIVAAGFRDFVYTSNDMGVSWANRSESGRQRWWSATMSSDGAYQAAYVVRGYGEACRVLGVRRRGWG